MRLAALAFACAALGAGRYNLAQVTATEQSVWRLNDSGDLTIEGVIAEDPRRMADAQRVLVATDQALVAAQARQVADLVQAKVPVYPERRLV